MDLLSALASSASSMEGRFLGVIALLDQAETLANGGVKQEDVSPVLALSIGEAKQRAIEEFAARNLSTTLAGMRKEYAPAGD